MHRAQDVGQNQRYAQQHIGHGADAEIEHAFFDDGLVRRIQPHQFLREQQRYHREGGRDHQSHSQHNGDNLFERWIVARAVILCRQHRRAHAHAHAHDVIDVDEFIRQRGCGELDFAVVAQHQRVHDVDADGDHVLQHHRHGNGQDQFVKRFLFDKKP